MEKNTVHLRGRGEYTGNIEVGFKSKVESLMLIREAFNKKNHFLIDIRQ